MLTLVGTATLLLAELLCATLVSSVFFRALSKLPENKAQNYAESTSQVARSVAGQFVALIITSLVAVPSAFGALAGHFWSFRTTYGALTTILFASTMFTEFHSNIFSDYDHFNTKDAQPVYNQVGINLMNGGRILYDVSVCWTNVGGEVYRTAINDGFYIAIACTDASLPRIVNASLDFVESPFLVLSDYVQEQGSQDLHVNVTVQALGALAGTLDPLATCLCEDLEFVWTIPSEALRSPNLATAVDRYVNAVLKLAQALMQFLVALFQGRPQCETLECKLERAPDLLPTANALCNGTVATGAWVDDIVQIIYNTFFAELQQWSVPRASPILTRPLNGLTQLVKLALDVGFHIDLVFDTDVNYLRYLPLNYVFYESYAWSYGIQQFFFAFNTPYTTNLACAAGGTLNLTVDAVNFVALFVQVVITHPSDTIDYVKAYDFSNFDLHAETAANCSSALISELNVPLGQTWQWALITVQRFAHLLTQLVANIEHIVDYVESDGFLQSVDAWFFALNATSIGLGNVVRQFDTGLDGAGDRLCPLPDPTDQLAPLPGDDNFFCCSGNALQLTVQLVLSVVSFAVNLVIVLVEGRSFTYIWEHSYLDLYVAVIPAVEDATETVCCLPASIFQVINNNQCPETGGYALTTTFTVFFLSFLNITAAPLIVVQLVVDTVGAALVGDGLEFIGLHIIVVMYDLSVGYFSGIVHRTGDLVGCLIQIGSENYIKSFADSWWDIFGWDHACVWASDNQCSSVGSFNLRCELGCILQTVVDTVTIIANFIANPAQTIENEFNKVWTDIRDELSCIFHCIGNDILNALSCAGSDVEDWFRNFPECAPILWQRSDCGFFQNCHPGGCPNIGQQCGGGSRKVPSQPQRRSVRAPRQLREQEPTMVDPPALPWGGGADYQPGDPLLPELGGPDQLSGVPQLSCAFIAAQANRTDLDDVTRFLLMREMETCMVSSAVAVLLSRILQSPTKLLVDADTFASPLKTWNVLSNFTRLPWIMRTYYNQSPGDPLWNTTWLQYANATELCPLHTQVGFFADVAIRKMIRNDIMGVRETFVSLLIGWGWLGARFVDRVMFSNESLVNTGLNMTRALLANTAQVSASLWELWNNTQLRPAVVEQAAAAMNNLSRYAGTQLERLQQLPTTVRAQRHRSGIQRVYHFLTGNYLDRRLGRPANTAFRSYLQREGYEKGSYSQHLPEHRSVTQGVVPLLRVDPSRTLRISPQEHAFLSSSHPSPSYAAVPSPSPSSAPPVDVPFCFDNNTCLRCNLVTDYVTDLVNSIVRCGDKLAGGIIVDPDQFAATPSLTLSTGHLFSPDLLAAAGVSTSTAPQQPDEADVFNSAAGLILTLLTQITMPIFGVNMTQGVLAVGRFFTEDDTNTPLSAWFWAKFLLTCHVDTSRECSPDRGLGLVTSTWVCFVTYLSVTLALSFMSPTLAMWVLPAFWFTFPFAWLGVAYLAQPRCLLPFPLPVLPECLADDIFRVAMKWKRDCLDWDWLLPGLTTPECPTAAEGYRRSFVDCSKAPYSFDPDGIRDFFFVLAWKAPAALDLILHSDFIFFSWMRAFPYLSDRMNFDWFTGTSPAATAPDTYISCFKVSAGQMGVTLLMVISGLAAVVALGIIFFLLSSIFLSLIALFGLFVLEVASGTFGFSTDSSQVYEPGKEEISLPPPPTTNSYSPRDDEEEEEEVELQPASGSRPRSTRKPKPKPKKRTAPLQKNRPAPYLYPSPFSPPILFPAHYGPGTFPPISFTGAAAAPASFVYPYPFHTATSQYPHYD